MKKLTSLEDNQIFEIVCNSEQLKEELELYINNSFSWQIDDMLHFVHPKNYSIGLGCYSYIEIENYREFVYELREYCNNFGLSEKCERLLKMCEKLRYTNLFEYHAKKLVSLFYHNEIQANIDYYEQLLFDLYNCEFSNNMADIFCNFLDGNYIDGYYLNNENKCVKLQYV